MTTWDTGSGTPGRARASKAQVIGMAHTVLEDSPERLVIRRWLCGSVATWRKVGTGRDAFYELTEET